MEERANILLVDDREDKLLALKTSLDDLPCNLVCVQSGKDALRLLLKESFALILMDVSMPDMDGFETAALIRKRQQSEDTPIIFITSINTSDTHVTRGYSLGAVDYIFSPIQSEILRGKVCVFIDLFNKNLQIKHQSELLRIEAERRAASLETRLQRLLENLGVGVFRLSEDRQRLLEANDAFLRLLGFDSFEQVSSMDLQRLNEGYDSASLQADSVSAEMWRDYPWRRSTSETLWISMNQSRMTDEKGETWVEGLVDDVSKRKLSEIRLQQFNDTLERLVTERTEALMQSQQLLRRSERLASLGTLAAGIAHEINNPLNSILMATDYAQRKMEEPAIIAQTLQTIAAETRRCGKIVKGVLQFARNEKRSRVRQDLNAIVQNGIDLAKTYVKKPVRIETRLSTEPLHMHLNAAEIEQVVINLIQNSVEAVTGDVQIGIETLRRNDRAVLRVSDNGPGIPEELQMRIFDPFYSTKTEIGGTGLGLSVVHGIVTEHEGSIRITTSSEMPGACFELEFPLSGETLQILEHVSSTMDAPVRG